MIPTIEIPKERWGSYLQVLSKVAAGSRIRMEVIGRELGDQELSNFLPMRMLDFEDRGSERGDLLFTVGNDEDEYTHHIRDAQRLHAGFDEAGALEWLTIEEAGGAKTLIYFQQPFLLEVGPAAEHAASY